MSDERDDTPDLSLLARQQRQILAELGSMRDDLAVLTAIVMRQDGTLAAFDRGACDALAAQPAGQPGAGPGSPAVTGQAPVRLMLCLVGLVALSGAALADDRHAIFWGQAQRFTNLGEEAEGLVRCGIRSERWSGEVQMKITEGVIKLADRLWPNGLTNDDELVAHDAALFEAYAALDRAADRGRHIAPQWCADTGGAIAPSLDSLVGGSE